MTFAALWAFLAVALPAVAALAAGLSTVDLAYQLRAGQELFDTGRIPAVDTWTFTAAGEPWFNQQWGAQALLAAVFRIGGWTGLAVLRAAFVAAMTGVVFLACRRQGLDSRSAALLALAAFAASSVAMALRPQLFGMVLFALVLLLVVERRRRPEVLWVVPIATIVWANVHGSFFLAPAVLGLAWLHDVHDRIPGAHRTLLVGVVSVVAACLTPFGPAVWGYAAGLSTNAGVTERITEWQPTSIRTPAGAVFFASALLVAGLLARRGSVVPWPALLWFAVFFLVGAWAIRGAAWWPSAAVIAVAGLVGTGFLGSGPPASARDVAPRERPRRANVVLAAAIVLGAAAALPVWRPAEPGLDAPRGLLGNAPPGITEALRGAVTRGDHIYHPQPWGSWFEFAVPEALVAVDSRFELFPPEVWRDYEAVAAGRSDWREILERWRVTIVVATNEQRGGLLEQLRRDPGWRSIHADSDGEVFVRADR